jgi:septal ring factor EnvC (AmiA/AmiB activator)
MQKPNWHVFLLLLCVLVLLCLARPISGQESSEPSIPKSSLESLPKTSDPWQSFDQAWESLKNELNQSELDLDVLLKQLQNLQTEAQELRRLYLESTKQLESLEQANKDILIARDMAIVSRDKWRLTAFIAPVVAISCGFVIGIILPSR